jgi:hypothetical protein
MKEKELFINEVKDKQLGLLDILREYNSLVIPMDAFFQIANKIMVRKR